MDHPVTVASKENDRKLIQNFIAGDNNPWGRQSWATHAWQSTPVILWVMSREPFSSPVPVATCPASSSLV